MITGLLSIKFQDGATDEDIQEIVSNFYGQNSKLIKGMQYLEFRDPKTLDRVNAFLIKDDNAVRKEPEQSILGNAYVRKCVDGESLLEV